MYRFSFLVYIQLFLRLSIYPGRMEEWEGKICRELTVQTRIIIYVYS